MKEYKRLFTFGCSFTQYNWPTWANIIAVDTGIPHYNFAMPGVGNLAIMLRMIQADAVMEFTDDDLVMVGWSTQDREDRIINGMFINGGSVFNNRYFSTRWLKRYYNPEHYELVTKSAQIAVEKMFPSAVHVQMFNNQLIDAHGQIGVGFFKRLMKSSHKQTKGYIKRTFDQKLPKFIEVNPHGKDMGTYADDGHPDIPEHILYAETILGRPITAQTRDYFDLLHDFYSKFKNIKHIRDNKNQVWMARPYPGPNELVINTRSIRYRSLESTQEYVNDFKHK